LRLSASSPTPSALCCASIWRAGTFSLLDIDCFAAASRLREEREEY
jgi:hypothetical protein